MKYPNYSAVLFWESLVFPWQSEDPKISQRNFAAQPRLRFVARQSTRVVNQARCLSSDCLSRWLPWFDALESSGWAPSISLKTKSKELIHVDIDLQFASSQGHADLWRFLGAACWERNWSDQGLQFLGTFACFLGESNLAIGHLHISLQDFMWFTWLSKLILPQKASWVIRFCDVFCVGLCLKFTPWFQLDGARHHPPGCCCGKAYARRSLRQPGACLRACKCLQDQVL